MLKTEFLSDQRGEMYVNRIKGTEFNILFTRAGAYRGGDYHSGEQYNLILKGRFKIILRQNNKDITEEHGHNKLIVIPAGIPHLFKAITDTVLIEWKIGSPKSRYYQPYRKIINQRLDKLKN